MIIGGELKNTSIEDQPMADDRYFLDRHGAVTRRMQGAPGQCHIDIAREVLSAQGIVPANDEDHYQQMFRLRYARVVERADGTVEVEHGSALTTAQKRFIADLKDQKKVVNVSRRPAGKLAAARQTSRETGIQFLFPG
jgi:hypothetical protein